MAVESAADRLAFLNPDEFGVEATYTPISGSPTTINVLLDEDTAAADLGGLEVNTTILVAYAREADVPDLVTVTEPADLYSITIAGTTYRIADWQRLEGILALHLMRAG